jgi:peptide chain release factor 2
MYFKYFENHNYKITLVDESPGDEVGYKEVSFEVEGYYPFGHFKWEKGTHRLVRLSPFNANNLRQTSFALVEVTPLIKDSDGKNKIKSSDLEWHFSRSGGPGGQNVNKVSSAVELTYKPLNLTVRCRQLKSQLQNKELALEILQAKITLLKEEQNQKEIANLKGSHRIASFGNQIRNYVLHPYKLVKDTRTKAETSQAMDVLDGDLDIFINAEIKSLKN